MQCIERTPSRDASVGRARPTALVNQGNQAEAQPSQTNSAQPFWGSSSAVMGRGGGARGKRPAPAVRFPAPAVLEVGPCRRPASGAVLASCRGLASPVYRWVFVLALRRFPAPGSTARGPTGPVSAEGGKKIANRASLRSGPRGAPALFSAPGGRSTFCTISAYRRFFVRSLLSLCVATLLPAAPNEGDDGQNDKRTALVSFLITVRWLTFLSEQAIP